MTSDLTQRAPTALRSLDPGLLQVIRSSADRLIHMQDAFIQHLYSDITTMIPDLTAGGWTFCERMVHAVLWAATTDQAPQEIITALRWVGARNRLEGFPEAQYLSLAHALVRTVHMLSEDYWSTSTTSSAWVGFFIWMKPHFLAGAQQAAAQEAAWQEAYPAQSAVSGSRGEYPPVTADDIDLESVASLLDDEDDDDESPGYGQIMASMSLKQRRERPLHPD
jgi:hypothetical protein